MRQEEKRGLSNFAWDVFKTSGNIESYLLYNEIHEQQETQHYSDYTNHILGDLVWQNGRRKELS